MKKFWFLLATLLAFTLPSCRSVPAHPAGSALAQAPSAPACDNDALTSYPALLVLAPHPDDEVLGFAGLIDAYKRQGKMVKVVVTTDGDAYCEACRFWKNSTVDGPPCDAADLSNFATAEIDSFAEVRRTESTAAVRSLGLPAPEFLGYPDTGLGAAWINYSAGEFDKRLRRSDFSGCATCEACPPDRGYGAGPETDLTAQKLVDTLRERIAAMPAGTLIATVHWLDGHQDHASLGSFVKLLNEGSTAPRPVAYTVIHAHTAKTAAQPDCWFPFPSSSNCPCMDEKRALADPGFIERNASERFLPKWPAGLPDDAEYGDAKHLCLSKSMYAGRHAVKAAAVRSYASQLGRVARKGTHPKALDGLLDCSGYLMSFVRSTEAFVLIDPAPPKNVAER